MENTAATSAGAGTSGAGASGAGAGAGASSGAGSSTSTVTNGAGAGAGAGTSGAGAQTIVDGNQGAGALDHDAAVEAMVAAAAAKGFGDQAADTASVANAETPIVDPTATTEGDGGDQTQQTTEGDGTQGEDQHSYSLEEDGFVGARDLAAKLEAEAVNLSPELRNEIMANARLAETAAAYRQIFASPEEAKVIQQTAQEYSGMQEAFFSLTPDNVVKGTSDLINKMREASALRDDEGNIVRDPQTGQMQTDGTVGRFLTEASKRWFDLNVVQKAEALKDDSVAAALDLVLESVGLRPSTADKTENIDPAIAQREAAVRAREQELQQQQQAAKAETVRQYKTTKETQLQSLVTDEVGTLLKPATALSEYDRKNVERDIHSAIRQAVKSNLAYQRELDMLGLRPMGPKRMQAEVDLARRFLRGNLAQIARPILTAAGVSVKGKADARQATQTAREEASRGNVKGGSSTQQTRTQAPQDAAGQRAAVASALEKKLGRSPSDSEVNQEMMVAAFERRKSA